MKIKNLILQRNSLHWSFSFYYEVTSTFSKSSRASSTTCSCFLNSYLKCLHPLTQHERMLHKIFENLKTYSYSCSSSFNVTQTHETHSTRTNRPNEQMATFVSFSLVLLSGFCTSWLSHAGAQSGIHLLRQTWIFITKHSHTMLSKRNLDVYWLRTEMFLFPQWSLFQYFIHKLTVPSNDIQE